jgi:hypothetical protein
MTCTEFIHAVDAEQIETLLETARQLRAAVPADVALSDVEGMRVDAARMLERAADLLGAARAEETRAAWPRPRRNAEAKRMATQRGLKALNY